MLAGAQVETRPLSVSRAKYLLAGGLLFLVLLLTRAAEQNRDSLVYAYAARTGTELFHPHHLIYSPAVRLVYLAIRPLCPGCDAVFAGQVHNILWSAAGALALFAILRRVWGPPAALAGSLLLVSLRGYWELSTQTTMYVPGAALLALLSAALLAAPPRPSTGLRPGRLALLAGLLALAVLYHQANVLFAAPLGVYLVAARGKRGLREWLVIAGLAGLAALAVYVLVYLLTAGAPSLPGFVRFCLSYTSEICLGGTCKTSPDGWGSLGNLSPGGLRQLLSSLTWNVVVLPAGVEPLALPVVGLGILALTGWHAVQAIRRPANRPLRLFCLAWFYAFTIFFFWWLPSYQHPFAAGLVPLIILSVLALRDGRALLPESAGRQRAAAAVLAGLALLLAGRNFSTRVLPLNRSRGEAYQEAAALHASAPAGCVFLTSYRTWNNLRYYFDSPTAVQARHPLSFFTLGQPLPEAYHIADQPCVYAAVAFLLPTFTDEDYSDDPVNAYQTPDRWLAYLSWLLDIRPAGAPDGAVTSRDFVVVTAGEDALYLRLLPTRRADDSLEALFLRLDAALQDASQPFFSWYSTVKQAKN